MAVDIYEKGRTRERGRERERVSEWHECVCLCVFRKGAKAHTTLNTHSHTQLSLSLFLSSLLLSSHRLHPFCVHFCCGKSCCREHNQRWCCTCRCVCVVCVCTDFSLFCQSLHLYVAVHAHALTHSYALMYCCYHCVPRVPLRLCACVVMLWQWNVA